MLDYHINGQIGNTTHRLQNVGSRSRHPLEITLDYAASLPYIAQYKNHMVGRCDESAQSVMQDPLCARALPHLIPQGEER